MSNTAPTTNKIHVISLNCWGLKFFSKQRRQRIEAIGEELFRIAPDVVGLQEVFVQADFDFLRKKLATKLPYAVQFHSGVFGPGLAVFSRFPVVEKSFYPFSLCGSAGEPTGDWLAGKGVAIVVIQHPILGEVEIFNTHLCSKGGENAYDYERTHRMTNAWEFANSAKKAAERGRFVIATGDFNSIPSSLIMTLVRDHGGLEDAWENTHERSYTPAETPEDALKLSGVTVDAVSNSFTAGKRLEQLARIQFGKRLDYIFYRDPPPKRSQYQLVCTKSSVVFTENIPGTRISYSDHFGVEAVLEIRDGRANDSGAEDSRGSDQPSQLSEVTINTAMLILHDYSRRCRAQAKAWLVIFILCIPCIFATALVSAIISNPWISVLLVLISFKLGSLGATSFYVGFLWGNWEVRSLTRMIEDLEVISVARSHL